MLCLTFPPHRHDDPARRQFLAGTDLQVVALAKHRGIRTINVVRRTEQRQELLDLGYGRDLTVHSLSDTSPWVRHPGSCKALEWRSRRAKHLLPIEAHCPFTADSVP